MGRRTDIVSNDDINKAAFFVKSPARWEYLRMLMGLGDVLVYMEAWFKACPCHSTLALGVRGETYHRRRKAFAEELLAHTAFPRPHAGCPMQSCKAPNAAAGEHWVLMDQWFAKCQQQVFIRSASGIVLDDFRVGRGVLSENLRDKLSFTAMIPFKIAVMAHRDEFVAREGIRECFNVGTFLRRIRAEKHH